MSHEALSPQQFGEYTIRPVTGGLIQASDKHGKEVGHLVWDEHFGDIRSVHVYPEENRRKGVATAMWHAAHAMSAALNIAPPQHSDDLTPEGKAWSKAVPNVEPEW